MKKSFTQLNVLPGLTWNSQLTKFLTISLAMFFAVTVNAKSLTITRGHATGNTGHSPVVRKADSSDATLSSMQISNNDSPPGANPVSPAFDPAVTAYTAITPYEGYAGVYITTTNPDASVTINGRGATTYQLNGVNVLTGAVPSNGIATIVVTSADRSVTQTYTLTDTRALPQAKLSALILQQIVAPSRAPAPPVYPLDQTFSPAVFNYTATVAYNVSSLPVSAVPTEPATAPSPPDVVKINGQQVGTFTVGSAAYLAVPLNFGQNVITVTVTSPDGSLTNTYTLTITRQYDPADATLASLQLQDYNENAIAISPIFDSSITTYTAVNPASNPVVTGMFNVTNPGATVAVSIAGSGGPAIGHTDGTSAYSMLLSPLNSIAITIAVTSADKSATKNYTVALNRGPALAKLSSLALQQICRYCDHYIPLDQTFSPDVFSYTATAPYSQAVAFVDALPTEAYGLGVDVVKINGAVITPGYTTPRGIVESTVPLNVGQNTITISVTSPDNSITHTYTITVTRQPPPSNDMLSGLIVVGGNLTVYQPLAPAQPMLPLNPLFDPVITNYSLTVASGMSQVSIFPSPSDFNNATMVINGMTLANINPTQLGSGYPANLTYPNINPINLNPGINVIAITVTAADQVTTQTYTLNITRQLPPPTAQALKMTFSNTTTTATTASWTSGNGSARAVFIASSTNGYPLPVNSTTYAANSSFAAGTEVGNSGWYCVYNGTGSGVNISGLTSGTPYRVSAVEYNGTPGAEDYLVTGQSPAEVTTQQLAPSKQSIHLNFTATTATTTTVNWTSGNGTSRAVFISKTSVGIPSTTDNTTYSANANFGRGTQIGTTGWYCIYNGNGSSANIAGLVTNTTYRVCVVEYGGTLGYEKYLTTNGSSPANVTTVLAAPTQQAIHVLFSNITGNSFTANWTSGNGLTRAVFLAQTSNGIPAATDNTTYNANTVFRNGTQCTAGWYCVYNGSGSTVNVSGLSQAVTYRLVVIEYNGTTGTQKYLTTSGSSPANVTTISSAPTVQALHLSFTNITHTSVTASWQSGNGQSRAVFLAKTSFGIPSTADQVNYTANTVFGFGTQSTAGWYCVYNGAGDTVKISGLVGGTTYRLMVVEYDGTTGNELYLHTSGGSPANFTTTGAVNSMTAVIPELSVNQDVRAKAAVTANNILSPNGDGVNDTWIIKNIDQYPDNKVTVYDKNGAIVFSQKGYTNDWSGTYRGSTLSEDTYYYLVELGEGSVMKGYITVVRDR